MSSQGSAAPDGDMSHADDGAAILERARQQQALGPRTAEEEMDASLSTVTRLEWSDVVLYKECGNGAFGTVYRGEAIGLDVAVKVANDDVIDDEGFLERFNRECGILAQLHHPNVLSLLAIVLDSPARKYAIVTPFCPNGDLMSFITAPADVLRSLDVKYGMKIILRFAIDIARGCRFLHLRARVIQRDLKLANVLVDRFCNALLADFGLSRILRSEGGQARQLTPCGSPAWTAPEIVEMRPYTRKVDVFSYGIMLWQLVAREEPYKGRENNIDLAMEVATEGLRPRIPNFCPVDYADLMTRCWAADPDDRPEFDEIQESLNKMRRAHGGTERHRIALVPDIDVLRETHKADIEKARLEAAKAGVRSARAEPAAAAAAGAAGAAAAAAAPL